MAAEFKSIGEFREVMDKVFSIMSEDPEMGPALREADVPQRFEFDDVDLVITSGPAVTGRPISSGSGPTTSTGAPR